MTQVIMPKMGDGMEEGTLLEWLKKEGDTVKSGEVIGNIQTDKATLELEAPSSGKLAGFLIQPGQTVPVGVPIAALLTGDEQLPEGWGSGGGSSAKAEAPKEDAPKADAQKEEGSKEGQVKETAPQSEAPKAEAPQAEAAPAKAEGRVKASPLAKNLAKDMGVDLSSVAGSGPGGRVTEKDVRDAAKNAPATAIAAAAPSGEDQVVPLNRLRQITAQRTTQSKQQVPHFYVTVEVDLEKALALKDQFEDEEAGKVTVNDFVIRATALALREMPVVNSSYQGETLLQHGGVNVGMAVALTDGLTVAVIRNADQLSLRQIGDKARELAKKARDNKLSMDELSGSTFSISNMGMLDVENFGAIINAPNAGILAVGTAKKTVVVNDEDEIEIRRVMKLTGSFDHRVVDGAVGAKFCNLVRAYLENPTRMF